MLEELKKQVLDANLALWNSGLVTLTWGNASGLDREQSLMVIKPSGVPYETLSAEHMVVLDLSGKVVDGELSPSTDTPTHLALYRAFEGIGGVTHCHSVYATAFAQASREIPCMGTTHADHFYGAVPVARALSETEVKEDYEGNTGKVIVERFEEIDPVTMPAVLVAHHGPFTWGKNATDSVKNAIALETVAHMALSTLQLEPTLDGIPSHILEKHHSRKHGPDAYYGQRM